MRSHYFYRRRRQLQHLDPLQKRLVQQLRRQLLHHACGGETGRLGKRLELVDPFEAEHEEPKQIAKRLQKAGLIERFNFKNNIFTLARRANGDCSNLDATTRRCTVYDKRPNTCRLHPQVGPKPGYCPYGAVR